MSEEKIYPAYDKQAPLPYSLRVSFEHDGKRVLGHIVNVSLSEGVWYYDILDSEDTLEHGILYEGICEDIIKEEELWTRKYSNSSLEKRWNPEMPWYQPDVRCANCGKWINARTAGATESNSFWCRDCARI